MENAQIISQMTVALHVAASSLAKWLSHRLPNISENWWENLVLSSLTTYQQEWIENKGSKSLDELDLACLLRVSNRNWFVIRGRYFLKNYELQSFRKMTEVRNMWAHCSVEIPPRDTILSNLETLCNFFEIIDVPQEQYHELKIFQTEFMQGISPKATNIALLPEIVNVISNDEFQVGSIVSLVSNPEKTGAVIQIKKMEDTTQFMVFIDGSTQLFFAEQIKLLQNDKTIIGVSIDQLKCFIAAQQIRNPATGQLYSLNSARIDFVPYQFRPALKMIKADKPRLLVADSVGVGKTIEAGLILRELQARKENFESVLIICPKPLVAERKWELEMQRFDERFTQLDGSALRQVLSDTDRDGEWPDQHKKVIIPYSLLTKELVEGNGKKNRGLCLQNLDPAPHFDLVIVDEAHHIRNSNTQAYQAVKFFCDNAEAVVMLTATPIQTSESDLYTLLNLLRPDIVLDPQTYVVMTNPNTHINTAINEIHHKKEGWELRAKSSLIDASMTQWGSSFVAHNPVFKNAINELSANSPIGRQERVELVRNIEGLHSFANLINRTRRQDIQDFCIRRTHTLEVEFTPEQKELHEALLTFEAQALEMMHGSVCVKFMMSMIRRQASSCLFGLAPFMESLVKRRLSQIFDDAEMENFTEEWDKEQINSDFVVLAKGIIKQARILPEEDPKFDLTLDIILKKQKSENNKIIVFSSFRHTLAYLNHKLVKLGYRVAQINGSVKDADRLSLRTRFEKNREEIDTIDILLFTEVGCEGLDYQFCDMMINYDLPWNPMRIEQRIGRIDRRGQKSEVVNIYNVITKGTVDADIYSRCLMRIGVFERNIGECSEILGEIATEIEKVATDVTLTATERQFKLEKIAENETGKLLEMKQLEQEQRELFGFDLSSYTMDKEVSDAVNPWISPQSLQELVINYLNIILGVGSFVIGEKELKTLRLSADARRTLRSDFKTSNIKPSEISRQWERYLKSSQTSLPITFDQECAEKNRNAIFINPVHPLLKQAAMRVAQTHPIFVHLKANTNDVEIAPGEYAFLLLQWNYKGMRPETKMVPVAEFEIAGNSFYDLIDISISEEMPITNYSKNWSKLEQDAYRIWQIAKNKHIEDTSEICNYRQVAFLNNYQRRKLNLQTFLDEAMDENLMRMRKSQLEKLENEKIATQNQLSLIITQADIHTAILVKGILTVGSER